MIRKNPNPQARAAMPAVVSLGRMAQAVLFAVEQLKRQSSADGSEHDDSVERTLRIAGCSEDVLRAIIRNEV